MIKIDKIKLEKRKQKLEKCRNFLKQEFIGIDSIIDNLIDYIQIWYLMPEILNRPIIINLWGMTGVGKTDLIRKMVKFLEFQERFVEIELSNIDQSSYYNSVSQILQNNNMLDEKESIILFDEIQRFNTLDHDGNPLPQTKFIDFWELLSDGRLSKKTKNDFEIYLYNYLFKKKENDLKIKKGEVVEDNYSIGAWEARELKNTLGIEDINSFIEMSEEDMIRLINKSIKNKKIFEPTNLSKTLLIISGNLDEAYAMADRISETDIDADIFHSFTKKITLVDIKNALSKKFRPEQVARFGNIHLIYNSLRKVDFNILIEREINRIIRQTKENIGIDLKISKNINELIYKNGVFPVQGVRPVFSSVIDILDTNLSKFVFEAIVSNENHIDLDYDYEKQILIAKIGKQKIKIPYTGRIDKIRQSNEIDSVANISVHESGHAVAYMRLMDMAPLQLKSKIANSYSAGFTFPHDIHETKETILQKIKIYLAGGIAEEIIFGKENSSIGRSADRETVTVLASNFIRKYGFDEEFQSVYNLEDYPHRMNFQVTDNRIEKLIAKLVKETNDLLLENIDLLKDLSLELSEKGSMEAKEVASIAAKHNVKVSVKEEGYLHIHPYFNQIKK